MVRDVPHGVTLDVTVIPRAGRTELAGTRGDTLLLRVAAPPVEGAANLAVVDLLSRLLDVAKRDIEIVSGEKSRTKRVKVNGVSAAAVHRRLRLT